MQLLPTSFNALEADRLAFSIAQHGFGHIPASFYVEEADGRDIGKLQASYFDLPADVLTPLRTRTHLVVTLENGRFIPALTQTNALHYESVNVARKIAPMDTTILALEVLQKIIWTDMDLVKRMSILSFEGPVKIGLHQVRYQPVKGKTAFSSPPGLHRDDEDVVFIHIVNVSQNLLGGENVICRSAVPKVEEGYPPFLAHINLTEPIEGLCVTRKHFHQVFPMSVMSGQAAYRDILLVTFEKTT